ncbi:MAG: site-2 protease family protein [Kiritimatiellae bacterium]|nr:site-2 protease family protein [Kiritimatiellia bacterium]
MKNLFVSLALQDPAYYFSWVLVVMFSICVHEFAHALIALKLGDDTAARSGHLTLNPMVQMGPSSIVMLLVIGIAWGAVPVDPSRIRSRAGSATVAFAGPGANLVLSAVFALLALVAARFGAGESLALRFLVLGSTANGVLFVFNMLPVPMFDGWSVFALAFPRMHNITPQQAQAVSWVFLAAVLVTGLFGLVWSAGGVVADVFLRVWALLLGPLLGAAG